MQTPMGVTPMMTPSYHQNMTTPGGRHQQVTPALTPGQHVTPVHGSTPQYQPTPRSGWNTSGLTPRTTSNLTPRATSGHRTPSQRQTPLGMNTDWAKAAQMWAKKKQEQSGKGTPRMGTPRITTPRIQPSPRVQQSPMVGEGGDTPLIDER
jgi:hypothetical protein